MDAARNLNIDLDIETQQALDVQRLAIDPTCHVWVSASAGTGKTKVLTDRLLNLLLQGINPRKVLCLTFTNAAAAEMMQRLLERLGDWASASQEHVRQDLQRLTGAPPTLELMQRARRLFVDILETPGGFRIQTLHGFCQSLLAAFPLEAGLGLETTVATDRERQELLKQAQEIVLNSTPQDEELNTAITLLAEHFHSETFKQLCDTLLQQKLKITLVLAGGLEKASQATLHSLGLHSAMAPERVLKEQWGSEAVDHRLRLQEIIFRLNHGKVTDQRRADAIQLWLNASQTLEEFYSYAVVFLTTTGEKRQKLVTRELLQAEPLLEDWLDQEADQVRDVLDHIKKQKIADVSLALLRLSHQLLTVYEDLKAKQQVLDYDDLILKSSLLLHHTELAPWILYKLEGGVDHVLVDEAQDTNRLQWSIVKALTEEFFSGVGTTDKPRTLFAVGDAKQSIYRFQGTDPEIFAAMRDYFADQLSKEVKSWRSLEMSLSFRSTAPVLEFVDCLFSQESVRQGVHEDITLRHLCFKVGQAGHLEVWPVVTPVDTDQEALPQASTVLSPRFRLAQHVAQQIESWFQQKERLSTRGRLLKPGDIMVLVRNRTEFVPALIQALKTKNIPVGGLDRLMLLDQLAIQDLLALAEFLLLVEDDFSLACVLKSPLGGLEEDDLFELAATRGDKILWDQLRDHREARPAFKAVYERLVSWRRQVDFLTPFALFSEILFRHQGWSCIVARFGQDVVDSLEEFLSLAYEYQRATTTSLQGFLQWLRQGRLEIKRDFSQSGLEEVRIMTVHGAKGLQAPVVILADTVSRPFYRENFIWPSSYHASFLWSPSSAFETSYTQDLKQQYKTAQDQEYRRLLYVALTRVEERLYVCGSHDQNKIPEGSWYQLLHDHFPKSAQKILLPWGEGLRYKTAHQQGEETLRDEASPTLDVLESVRASTPVWLEQSVPVEKEIVSLQRSCPSLVKGSLTLESPDVEIQLLKQLIQCPPEARSCWLDNVKIEGHPEKTHNIKKCLEKILRDSMLITLFHPYGRTDVPLMVPYQEKQRLLWLDYVVVLPKEVWIVAFKPTSASLETLKRAVIKTLSPAVTALQNLYVHHRVYLKLFTIDNCLLSDLMPKALESI